MSPSIKKKAEHCFLGIVEHPLMFTPLLPIFSRGQNKQTKIPTHHIESTTNVVSDSLIRKMDVRKENNVS